VCNFGSYFSPLKIIAPSDSSKIHEKDHSRSGKGIKAKKTRGGIN